VWAVVGAVEYSFALGFARELRRDIGDDFCRCACVRNRGAEQGSRRVERFRRCWVVAQDEQGVVEFAIEPLLRSRLLGNELRRLRGIEGAMCR
jgi:hypothetical protein